jgi:hypothetical protein
MWHTLSKVHDVLEPIQHTYYICYTPHPMTKKFNSTLHHIYQWNFLSLIDTHMHIPRVKSHCKENLEMPLLVERLECTRKDIKKNKNGQGPS